MQAMCEHMHLGIAPRNHLTVKPYKTIAVIE
jgi:hypothetical protein